MTKLRNEVITIRLTKDEKNNLLKKMKLAKISSISEFIRKLINTGYAVNINTNGLTNLIYEINKIGVNVNQLAKIANETHHIYENDFEKLVKDIDYINSILSELMYKISKIYRR